MEATLNVLNKLEWSECKSYHSYNEAKGLAVDGWRLPTIEELIDANLSKEEGFEAGFYWSSTTYSPSFSFVYLKGKIIPFSSMSHVLCWFMGGDFYGESLENAIGWTISVDGLAKVRLCR